MHETGLNEANLPELAGATRPRPGERVCGDAYAYWYTPQRLVLVLADGLGHGPDASAAAQQALQCVAQWRGSDCATIMRRCDTALQGSRGVAMALALIERNSGRAELAAVGNVRTVLVTTAGRERRFGAARGIVGAGYGELAPERVVLAAGEVLALYSDGLPELLALAPALAEAATLAAASARLVQQFALQADDAGLLLYRQSPAAAPSL